VVNVCKPDSCLDQIYFFLFVQEIFYSWTHKTDHFQKIHSKTGVPYNSMLFFDDDNNNIQEVTKFASASFFISMKFVKFSYQ